MAFSYCQDTAIVLATKYVISITHDKIFAKNITGMIVDIIIITIRNNILVKNKKKLARTNNAYVKLFE